MNRRDSRTVVACGVASAWIAIVACSGGPPNADPPPCANLALPDACPTPPPSWKKDVQPFVAKYCDGCHGVGGVEVSVRDFTTYQHVKTYSGTMASLVSSCRMPLPDAGQPTQSERETFVTWATLCQAPNN